eukprot:jgi/Chlat1/8295/Chrsp78S07712
MTTASEPNWANLSELPLLRVLAAAGGSAAGIAATVCRSWRKVAASETLWHELCESESLKKKGASTWAGTYAQEVRTRCNWQHGRFRTSQWSPQESREGHWVTGVYLFEGFIVLLQNVVHEGEQNWRRRLDVWDHVTSTHLHELRSWWNPAFTVLISGHRDRLVACDGTGAMHVWHIPSGRLLIHAVPDNPVPLVVRIEMNDTHLVTAHVGDNSILVRAWDAHHLGMLSHKRWREVDVEVCFGLHRSTVEFALSMTGRNVADGDLTPRREIIVWDLFAQEEVCRATLGYGYSRVNALFMDVNTIYVCFNESVCLWDKATQRLLRTVCIPSSHLRVDKWSAFTNLVVHEGWILVGMGWACEGALSENAVTGLDVFFAPVERRKGSRVSRKDKFHWQRALDGTEYLASPLVTLVACWPTICAIGTSSAVGMLTASPASNGTNEF